MSALYSFELNPAQVCGLSHGLLNLVNEIGLRKYPGDEFVEFLQKQYKESKRFVSKKFQNFHHLINVIKTVVDSGTLESRMERILAQAKEQGGHSSAEAIAKADLTYASLNQSFSMLRPLMEAIGTSMKGKYIDYVDVQNEVAIIWLKEYEVEELKK